MSTEELSWRQRHPEKNSAQRARWHKKNPTKTREYNLRHKFNMTLDDYEALVLSGGGVCAICGADSPGYRDGSWAIDHDHKCCPHQYTSSGKPKTKCCGRCIRGILCHSCNQKLGWYERNMEAIEAYIVERVVQ